MKHALRALIVLFACLASPAQADLNELFDKSFGGMINVTSPGAYSGSTRGILVGGSVEVRTKLTRAPNLLGITRPSVKAGCAGISIFGGAFSSINMDEFTEYLRSVMSNALGYLFKIGIESICPSCGKVLDSLEDFIGRVNSWMKDSCQMAKMLVDKSGASDMVKFEETNAFNQAAGEWASAIEGFVEKIPTPNSIEQYAYSKNPDEAKKAFEGNLVYDALKRANTANRFDVSAAAEVKKLYEQIMSLTGTILYKRNADNDIVPVPYHNTIDVKQLLGGPELSAADKEIVVLHCDTADDPYDQCMMITEVADATFLPMADRVSHLILGGSGRTARGLLDTPGIVARVQSDTALAAQEQALHHTTKIPFLSMLIQVRQYPPLVEDFGRQLSPLIAVDVVDTAVNQIIKEVERATSLYQLTKNDPNIKLLQDRLATVKADINTEISKVKENQAVLQNIIARHKTVRETLNGQTDMNFVPGTKSGNAS